MQGVLGELSPQKPNFGDKIQCLQRFADLFLPPSFHIFVINKPYRKRRFCPACFLNFCKTKKPLHMCGKKNGHKDSYAVPQKFLRDRKYVTAFNESNCKKYVIELSLKRGASQTYLYDNCSLCIGTLSLYRRFCSLSMGRKAFLCYAVSL